MNFDTDSLTPIYIQISQWLENEILNGNLKEDDKVYSQFQLAELFNINPATAAKSVTALYNEGIVYKKRGLGMFVSAEAKNIIAEKKKNSTIKNLLADIVKECKVVDIAYEEIIFLLHQSFYGEETAGTPQSVAERLESSMHPKEGKK